MTVEISEGPLYEPVFSGNRSLSDRRLKKGLVIFKTGNNNNIGLKKISSHILEKYREKGFNNATVSIQAKKKAEELSKKSRVEFVIHEGERFEIDSISMEGNASLKASKIKKQMMFEPSKFYKKHYYSARGLEEDINSIKALYRTKGFMQTEVIPTLSKAKEKTKEEGGVSIHLAIRETFPTLVSSVRIKGLTAVSMDKAMKVVEHKQGQPFREYMLNSDENALSAMISEKGYPYVTVKGRYDLSQDGKTAGVVYTVDQGAFARLGKVYFSG